MAVDVHPGQIVRVRYRQSRRAPEFPLGVITTDGQLWYRDNAATWVATPIPDPQDLVEVGGIVTGAEALVIADDDGPDRLMILPGSVEGFEFEHPFLFNGDGTWSGYYDLDSVARAADDNQMVAVLPGEDPPLARYTAFQKKMYAMAAASREGRDPLRAVGIAAV